MHILKHSIAAALVLIMTSSAVSVASADTLPKFQKSEKKLFLTAQAVSDEEISSAIPTKYSSVEKGWVTSVKNQQYHNTCWIFSTMSTLETALLKKGYGSYDLSEEHMDIWATERDNHTGWTRTLNSGSLFETAMGYLASWQGARLESQIPFDYAQNRTFEKVDKLGTTTYGVTDIVILPDDRDTIKTAVMNYGAVSANFSANSIFFNSDKTAAYAYKTFSNNAQVQGHAVSIVGWDDSYSKNNFKSGYTPPNDGAWLCKNSWGNNNSIGGYLWISYDDPYLFSDILSTPFAIKNVVPIDDNTKLYQVENYSDTYDFNLSEIDENGFSVDVKNITYINKFDFTDKYGNLEKVMFETMSVGADYTVYYIPLNNSGQPVSSESKWVTLKKGTVDYCGYRSVPVNYELPYKKGAVGVRIDGSANGVQSKLGCDEWLQNSSGKMLFVPDTQKNISFLKYNAKMYELSQFYLDAFDDEIGSNFVIKAITSADDGITKFDVNNDGNISLKDAVLAQRYLISLVDFSRNQLYSADIDGNGTVNLTDIVQIQRKILF